MVLPGATRQAAVRHSALQGTSPPSSYALPTARARYSRTLCCYQAIDTDFAARGPLAEVPAPYHPTRRRCDVRYSPTLCGTRMRRRRRMSFSRRLRLTTYVHPCLLYTSPSPRDRG
eukprot:3535352-Rhodomonas_salina.2